MNGSRHRDKQIPHRNRTKPIKKWLRREENELISFLKQNRDFEKPISRVYYNKFIKETGMEVDWQTVRSKVRNMRTRYRRAKEYEINKGDDIDCTIEDIRYEMLKTCWHVDDFDDIFPNEMDSYIYRKPKANSFVDFSNQESSSKINNSRKIWTEKYFQENELTSSSSSSSTDGDVFKVQEDTFNFKTQKHDKDESIKQQEIQLLKEKFSFEKEKFRQEFRLKEKEIESQERLKVMELQMKERIAMKELELKERLALQSMEKQETSYNNVYHNLT
ncbi:uncharacterized protein LOC135948679 [Calliphora vicina]|uniref:uncharacterized protein LOC135948679 n=1 Tax=Calliphora vicina TaxID=7373 RepID=UPI00325AE9F6